MCCKREKRRIEKLIVTDGLQYLYIRKNMCEMQSQIYFKASNQYLHDAFVRLQRLTNCQNY